MGFRRMKKKKRKTCFEINCLMSFSVVSVLPLDLTTNATGTSPAASSFILK